MTTVEVKLDLPDALAREVARMGLLEPNALQAMLREAVRARRIERLTGARKTIAAAGMPPLTMGTQPGLARPTPGPPNHRPARPPQRYPCKGPLKFLPFTLRSPQKDSDDGALEKRLRACTSAPTLGFSVPCFAAVLVPKRAHFLLLLTPGALDRCTDETDWVRHEFLLAPEHRSGREESVDPVAMRAAAPEAVKAIFGQSIPSSTAPSRATSRR